MNKKGPTIQGECCTLALYCRYPFVDCVSPDNSTNDGLLFSFFKSAFFMTNYT